MHMPKIYRHSDYTVDGSDRRIASDMLWMCQTVVFEKVFEQNVWSLL
jgi:hypothetical protein